MIIHIEGLRFAGKTTLIPLLASLMFKSGLSVAMIPEWRFVDNGPADVDEWIEKVIIERKHSRDIAITNNADIVILDRSFVGLEAFIACSFPEKLGTFNSMVGEHVIPDLEIFLFAEKKSLIERAILRQGNDYILNDDRIFEFYKKVYERLGIQPISFDTTNMSSMELADRVYQLFLDKYHKMGRG